MGNFFKETPKASGSLDIPGPSLKLIFERSFSFLCGSRVADEID
jgi:hypothetical protein